MDSRKFEIIQQLMAELQEEMDMDGGDISERLGKVKPEMEIKIESEGPMIEGEEEMMPEMEMEGPEEKLKSRLMKMRG